MSRRNSQEKWYHNRGLVKASVACEGSGQPPSSITDWGDWHREAGSARIKGKLPRGFCPECEDEMALNMQDDSWCVRKHNSADAPYKRQILLSEKVYRILYEKSIKENIEPDELTELIIRKALD